MKRERDNPGLIAYLDERMGPHFGRGAELQWHCAFCLDRAGDESSKATLRFNVVKHRGICYRCGFKFASLEGFFVALNGGKVRTNELAYVRGEVETVGADKLYYAVLAALYAPKGRPASAEAEPRPVPLPAEYVPLWRYAAVDEVPRLARNGWAYATGRRGLSVRLLRKFRVGYCWKGEYAGRLVFPVAMGGRQVYHTNRFCGDHPLKSKNPPNREGFYTATRCLLNYDRVLGAPVVYLSEGPLDVTAGADDTVGLMGKRVSPEQVRLLEILAEFGTREFVVLTDADADPGDVYADLVDHVPAVSVLALDRGDPDSRRADLPALKPTRGPLTLHDRVRARLSRGK